MNQRQKEPLSQKAKLYWAIGIIIAVLVAALLIWHTFFFGNQNATAATIGDQEFSTTEVAYYYHTVANGYISQARQYQQLGMNMGYDASLSPSEQFYNEEEGITYADYFMEQALGQLQQVTILCKQAEDAGYTLSEEGKQMLEKNMEDLYLYSVQSGMGSESAYIKASYGRNMSKSLLKDILTKSILASEYAKEKQEAFSVSEEDLNAYYKDHPGDLDSYDYRYCYINAEFEDTTDENGQPTEPTEEQTKAAMDAASKKANSMINKVKSGTAFNAAAKEYLDEESAASYSDPEFNHKTKDLGTSLSTTYKDWLTDNARKSGDITSLEVKGTGYCVIQFLGREKDDKSYQTMTYRSIQLLAETSPNEDGTPAVPTKEQLAAAKEKAQSLLDQWKKGDASAESFGTLAKENSTDETTKEKGGLHEDANRDTLEPSVTDWLFADGRKAGDTSVVEVTDGSGNAIGYQILYAEAFGQIRWKYQADNALRTADYDHWYGELQKSSPSQLTDVGKKIPNL